MDLPSLDSLKPKGTTIVSTIISGAFFAGTLLVNIGSTKTHSADVQAQQERRITVLEEVVRNELATRRELQDFKTDTTGRLIRIENSINEELRFHRR